MLHRQRYSDSPALVAEVIDLLSAVFPFFREQEKAARRLGLRWEECSTPFVYRENGTIVSHVGVLRVPLVLDGTETIVGSVHAVATHPEHRRRGYYRSLLDEVLEWCEQTGLHTLHLCTDNPEFFEPFGFRIIEEHHFVGGAPSQSESPTKLTELVDETILRRLLEARDPVSHLLGTRDRDVFLFNEARHQLQYAEDLDAVLSFDVEHGVLKLWDVVSARMPRLDDLLPHLPGDFEAIEVHFTPDRLGDGITLYPVVESRETDVLMARGAYPVEGKRVKLPATVRC